jgi:hypothetical protein
MQDRSIFITAVGYIFSVLAGLCALYCLMFLFLPQEQLLATVKEQQAAMPQGSPMLDPATLASLIRGVMFCAFVIVLWLTLSAIGLVKRKSWARISCIVLLVLGAVVGALYLLIGLAGSSMPGMAEAGQGRLHAMALIGAAFAALCVFTVYQLNTAKVKQEFAPPAKP